jgi:hypothetical protein
MTLAHVPTICNASVVHILIVSTETAVYWSVLLQGCEDDICTQIKGIARLEKNYINEMERRKSHTHFVSLLYSGSIHKK